MSVTAIYTGNSIKYKQDGTQVRAKVPRFETGLCSQGIMGEEGVTPLPQNCFFTAYTGTLDDDTEDTFTNWINYIVGTGRTEAVSDSDFGGVAMKVVQTDSTVAGQIRGAYNERTLAAMGLVVGDTISLAARYKMSAQTSSYVMIRINCYNDVYASMGILYLVNAATAAVANYTEVKLENQVIPAGTTRVRFQAFIYSTAAYSGQNNWLIVDYFTCEKKAYCTSPTDVTRAAETLAIPTAGVFTKGSATVEFTFEPTSTQVVTGKTGVLWYCWIDNNNRYMLAVNADGRVYAAAKSGGADVTTYNAGDPVLSVGTKYRISVKWNGTTMCHYVAGVKGLDGDVAYVEPVGTLPANTYLGSSNAGANYANGIYDDLCISSTARQDADMATRGAQTTPLTKDQYTTALITFDNTLRDKVGDYSVTDNSPSAGYIAWSNLDIQYEGIIYNVADGNTDLKFAWWDYDDPYVLQTSNTLPTLTDDDVLVFFNKNGTHLTVPKATIIEGGLIVSESILTDALAANSVTGVKILAGAISADHIAANAIGADKIAASAVVAEKIAAGAVTTAKLAAGAVTANEIAANAVTATKINVSDLSAINANLGNVTAGTISADVVVAGVVKYRTIGVPTNNPAPSGITVITNPNGTMNIKLEWSAYTQGTNQADHLIIFWKKGTAPLGAPTVNDSPTYCNVNTSAGSYYTFEGVNPADNFSFGIAAARRTENGMEIGAIQSPTSAPDWQDVTSGTPNYTGNIQGNAALHQLVYAGNGSTIVKYPDNQAPDDVTVTLPSSFQGTGFTLDNITLSLKTWVVQAAFLQNLYLDKISVNQANGTFVVRAYSNYYESGTHYGAVTFTYMVIV